MRGLGYFFSDRLEQEAGAAKGFEATLALGLVALIKVAKAPTTSTPAQTGSSIASVTRMPSGSAFRTCRSLKAASRFDRRLS